MIATRVGELYAREERRFAESRSRSRELAAHALQARVFRAAARERAA